MEDNLLPLIEDDLYYKATFDIRQPLMGVNLDGSQLPLMEHDLLWKTTFRG